MPPADTIKINVKSLKNYMRVYNPSSPDSPDTWSGQETGNTKVGDIFIMFHPAKEGIFDQPESILEISGVALVYREDAFFPMNYLLDEENFEMSFMEGVLSSKASEAKEAGFAFYCLRASVLLPLTKPLIATLASMEKKYGGSGERKSAERPDPLFFFLSSLGIDMSAELENECIPISELAQALWSPHKLSATSKTPLLNSYFSSIDEEEARASAEAEASAQTATPANNNGEAAGPAPAAEAASTPSTEVAAKTSTESATSSPSTDQVSSLEAPTETVPAQSDKTFSTSSETTTKSVFAGEESDAVWEMLKPQRKNTLEINALEARVAEKGEKESTPTNDEQREDTALRNSIAKVKADKEQADREQAAKELAAKELEAKELAAKELEAKELAAKELEAKELAAKELEAKELAAKELEAKELAAKELEAKELAAKELEAKELAAKELEAKELAAKELEGKELAAKELEGKELAAKELEANEQAAKEPQANEQAVKEPQANEQAVKEPQANEQAVKEPAANEQAAKELETKEKGAKEPEAKEQVAKELEEQETKDKAAKESSASEENNEQSSDASQNIDARSGKRESSEPPSAESTQVAKTATTEKPDDSGSDETSEQPARKMMSLKDTLERLEEQKQKAFNRLDEFRTSHETFVSQGLADLRENCVKFEHDFNDRLKELRKSVMGKLRLLSIEADQKLSQLVDEGRGQVEQLVPPAIAELDAAKNEREINESFAKLRLAADEFATEYADKLSNLLDSDFPKLLAEHAERESAQFKNWREGSLEDYRKAYQQISDKIKSQRNVSLGSIESRVNLMLEDLQAMKALDEQSISEHDVELSKALQQSSQRAVLQLKFLCDKALAGQILPFLAELKTSLSEISHELRQSFAQQLDTESQESLAEFDKLLNQAKETMTDTARSVAGLKASFEKDGKTKVDKLLASLSSHYDKKLDEFQESFKILEKENAKAETPQKRLLKRAELVRNSSLAAVADCAQQIEQENANQAEEILDAFKKQTDTVLSTRAEEISSEIEQFKSRRQESLKKIEDILKKHTESAESIAAEFIQ